MRARAAWGVRCGFPLLVIATLAQIGCGTPSGSAETSSPTAQQILSRAASVDVRDATVKITANLTTPRGTSSEIMVGTITASPDRADLTISRPSPDGQALTVESIFDVATHTIYSKVLAPASLASGQWTRGPLPDVAGTDYARAFLSAPFASMKDARFIGADRVNTIAVWHFTTTAAGSAAEQLDIFLRQDTYVPVRMVSRTANQRGPVDLTCDYTAVNTGASIALPAPQDLQAT